MTPTDISRLHDRIDELDQNVSRRLDAIATKTSALAESVSGVVAKCGVCCKTVMGNGSPPLGERFASLEGRMTSLDSVKSKVAQDHDAIVALQERDATRVRIGWKSLALIVAVAGVAIKGMDVLSKGLGW